MEKGIKIIVLRWAPSLIKINPKENTINEQKNK